MLWYPVGFAAGYLALLLFVAAPLRRSGAFTLPDFCELRLGSRRLRKLATAFVMFIGWLYLVPQLQGAGLTLHHGDRRPYALGALLVGGVVTANVALGGMRAITFVQAFQYWLKLTALAVPVIFLLLQWQADGRPGGDPAGRRRSFRPRPPSWSSEPRDAHPARRDVREWYAPASELTVRRRRRRCPTVSGVAADAGPTGCCPSAAPAATTGGCSPRTR